MDVTITIGNLPNGEGAGERLRAAIRTAGDSWGLRQVARSIQAFRDGGHQARGGSEWRPWSPRYAEYARERGRRLVLVDTGTLRQSLTHRTASDPGMVTIWLGSPVPYFESHQFGRGVPQRKVFEVTETDMLDLTKRLREATRTSIGRG